LKAEQQAGKFMYRGFGTNKPGGIRTNLLDMHFKNTANTSIVWHGDKLLALWEGGLPHELEPHTLETLSRYDYEGVLSNDFSWLDRKIFPELPFSAHPKIHPQSGIMYNFGTAPGLKNRLIRYEVSGNGKARLSGVTEMKRLYFTHDFVLTEEGYQVYFLTPVNFNLFKAFTGLDTPVGSMSADEQQPISILIVDPDGGERMAFADFGFIFHFINGFLDRNCLIIDGLMMEEWPDAEGMRSFLQGNAATTIQPVPTRYQINLDTLDVVKKPLAPYAMEFPYHHPDNLGRSYRYAWGIGKPQQREENPLLDGLLKLDLLSGEALYRPLEHQLPGEPLFIPQGPEEDQGICLLPLYDGALNQSFLAGFRAQNFEPIFKARLPHNPPLGFHGCWVDQIF
jgi:all-trans-8'-apo-beta-carotenal 15,15'-oxygenase